MMFDILLDWSEFPFGASGAQNNQSLMILLLGVSPMIKRSLFACICLLWLPLAASAEPQFAWSSLLDSGASLDDNGSIVVGHVSGDVVVAGVSHDGIEGSDILVRRLAAKDGAAVWTRRIPAFDDSDMSVAGLAWDEAGELIVAGHVLGCVG